MRSPGRYRANQWRRYASDRIYNSRHWRGDDASLFRGSQSSYGWRDFRWVLRASANNKRVQIKRFLNLLPVGCNAFENLFVFFFTAFLHQCKLYFTRYVPKLYPKVYITPILTFGGTFCLTFCFASIVRKLSEVLRSVRCWRTRGCCVSILTIIRFYEYK